MTPPSGRQGGKLKITLAIVGAVLLLCCIGGVALVVQSGLPGSGTANKADVGDCLGGKSIDQSNDNFQKAELDLVECADADAKYKVIGKVENKTQGEANNEEVCRPFTGAEVVYWEGPENKKGTVLCLQTNKK
jgi:hypothetical protein